jgi:hypothetical protein
MTMDATIEGRRGGHDDLVLAAWLVQEDRDLLREHHRQALLAKLKAQLPQRVH